MTIDHKAQSYSRGFTLIETIIYMGLFSLIMSGFLVGVYQILEAHNFTQDKVYTQEEGSFLIHKIDWALAGASVIYEPTVNTSGEVLRVKNKGITYEFRLESEHIQLSRDASAFSDLNGNVVKISGLSFNHTDIDGPGGKPASVIASFYVNGQYFESLRYLRQ